MQSSAFAPFMTMSWQVLRRMSGRSATEHRSIPRLCACVPGMTRLYTCVRGMTRLYACVRA